MQVLYQLLSRLGTPKLMARMGELHLDIKVDIKVNI